MSKTKLFKIVSIVLLVAWCVIIFMFSAQNAEESSKTSGTIVVSVIEAIYPKYETLHEEQQKNIIDIITVVVRKTAHFLEYFILGAISFLTVTAYTKREFKFRALLAIVFCVAYSISDEIHQYFVPGRACRILDVFIDSMGSLTAILLLVLIVKKTVKFVIN